MYISEKVDYILIKRLGFNYNLRVLPSNSNPKHGVCHVLTTAQVEFWTREFGFLTHDPNLENVENLLKDDLIPIVEIRDGIADYSHLPANSIVALCHVDEKYDYELFQSIINCDAFIGVIRQYGMFGKKKTSVVSAIFFGVFQNLRIKEITMPRRTIGWMIEGLRMKNRQTKMKELAKDSHKFVLEIPLGYTDYFVETFVNEIPSKLVEKFNSRGSLLEIAEANLQFFSLLKKTRFVFIGQIGQIVRRQAIEALKKLKSKNLVLRDGYGGVSNDENRALRIGEEYVDGLLNSKISVCPPGNISGNSYRIMESLICGAYPAVMSNIMCDPLFESPVIEVIKPRKPRTWSGYLAKLESVPDDALEACVLENLHKFQSEIAIARAKLLAAQNKKLNS